MYAKKLKVPKREALDEGWYTILNHNSLKRLEWDKNKGENSDKNPLENPSLEYYQVASIDPATDNFCLRIERWWFSGGNSGRVTLITFIKTGFKAQDQTNVNMMYFRCMEFLSNYISDLIQCHYIISERQLHINYKAVRISTFALALIMNWIKGKGNNPIIIEVNPRLKYHQLGAPRGWTDKQLKTIWTPEKALEILGKRGDLFSTDIITKSKKKDDYSDTVLQVEALFDLLQLVPNVNLQIKIKKIDIIKEGIKLEDKEENKAKDKIEDKAKDNINTIVTENKPSNRLILKIRNS